MNVIAAIEGVLSVDQAIRQQSEHLLEEFKKSEDYSLILLKTGKEHTSEGVRSLAYVLLRKHFSADLWKSLKPETKLILQKELLLAASTEKNKKMQSHILYAISELVNAMDDTHEKWNECNNYARSCIESESIEFKELGFRLLSRTIVVVSEAIMANPEFILSHFATAFNTTVSANTIKYIDAALECYSHLVCYAKEVEKFSQLIPSILKSIMGVHLIKDEEGLKGMLDSIIDISDSEPKFLLPNYFDLWDLCCSIATGTYFADYTAPKIALELLVNIMERYKEKTGSNGDKLRILTECIFKIMVCTDKEIDETWTHPKDGFREEDEEEDGMKFGESIFSRLCGAAEESVLMPIILSQCQQLIANEDWRYKTASLIVISQVGEFMAANMGLTNVVNVISEQIKNANSRVKFSALHAIGQIAEDVEEFADGYQKQLLPILKTAMCDPCIRVQSQAVGALSNVLENINEHDMKQYIGELLPALIILVKDGMSLTKENSLRCISTLAEVCTVKFEEHLQEIMTLFIPWLKEAVNPLFKEMRGLLIECISIIAESTGKEKFLPYFETIVKEFVNIQESQIAKEDLLKPYLLSAWEKLCITYQGDMLPYLDILMPSILKMAESMPGMGIETEAAPKVEIQSAIKEVTSTHREKIHITSNDIEEKLEAMHMIETFLKELRGGFSKYLVQTTKILLNVVNYTANESIRKTAADCLAYIVPAAQEANASHEGLLQLCNSCIEVLLKSMKTEYEPDVIMHQCNALKCLIMKGMDTANIQAIFQNLVAAVNQSNLRKEDNKKAKDEDDLEEEFVEQNNEMEDDLQIAITDVIGEFFKTNPDQSTPLLSLLYPSLIVDFLKVGTTTKQQMFAIYIIVDLIEFLGVSRLQVGPYEHMLQQLLIYTESLDPKIVQACHYGLGAVAMTCSNDLFEKHKEQIIAVLSKGTKLEIKKPKKIYGAARDNAVSSIGKILKYQPKSININWVIEWASMLPLKYDTEEGMIQAEILFDICFSLPVNDIKPFIRPLFMVMYKLKSGSLAEKVKAVVKMLEQDGIKEAAISEFQTLESKVKDKLQKNLK